MLGVGQTSDLSSVSWWVAGSRDNGGTAGTKLLHPASLSFHCCPTVDNCCRFNAMHCTVGLWVPPAAVSGAAHNPLMPMGAHHHPGVQYACYHPTKALEIP